MARDQGIASGSAQRAGLRLEADPRPGGTAASRQPIDQVGDQRPAVRAVDTAGCRHGRPAPPGLKAANQGEELRLTDSPRRGPPAIASISASVAFAQGGETRPGPSGDQHEVLAPRRLSGHSRTSSTGPPARRRRRLGRLRHRHMSVTSERQTGGGAARRPCTMNRVTILTTNADAARFEPLVHGDTEFAFDLLTAEGPRRLVEGTVWAFVDWVMDDLSGLEMCRRLRADPRTRGAHVTIVLEADDGEDRRRALRAGADDYAIGPLDRRAMLDRVL